MTMDFQIIKPPKSLERYVRFFWTVDFPDSISGQNLIRVFARRFPRMVFQHNNGHSSISKNGIIMPNSFLSGINTEPYLCKIDKSFSLTTVSFYPFAIKALFGIDAFELTDELPDFQNFAPKYLIEMLLNTENQKERIEIISNFLLKKINAISHNDIIVEQSLIWLNQNPIEDSVPHLLEYFNISERQLERKFKTNMGLSPKQFLRVTRFEKALNMLHGNQFSSLTDLAFELNYVDQSHFIREFKEFSNYTPKEYSSQQKLLKDGSSILIPNEN
jgi:AraC-like DNA-binding protein